MSCYQNFSMFDLSQDYSETPIPDEMKEKISNQLSSQKNTLQNLIKKYLNNQQMTDVELQQLSEKERSILQGIKNKNKDRKKKKRPDEYHKMFYKNAFKYSTNKFFGRKKNKSRRMSLFYHHHFDKVSQETSTPITSFYHPDKQTKPGLKIGQKTFNLSYVRTLLKSKSFRMDVKEFHHIFKTQQRENKIRSFTNSLMRIANRSEDPQQIVRYLQSPQCKIPWTNIQLEEAGEMVKKELQKFDDLDNNNGPLFEISEQCEQPDIFEQAEKQSSFFKQDLQLLEV